MCAPRRSEHGRQSCRAVAAMHPRRVVVIHVQVGAVDDDDVPGPHRGVTLPRLRPFPRRVTQLSRAMPDSFPMGGKYLRRNEDTRPEGDDKVGKRRSQSTLAPDAFTTSAHLGISDLM